MHQLSKIKANPVPLQCSVVISIPLPYLVKVATCVQGIEVWHRKFPRWQQDVVEERDGRHITRALDIYPKHINAMFYTIY
jgi:hypothetical protein